MDITVTITSVLASGAHLCIEMDNNRAQWSVKKPDSQISITILIWICMKEN